MHTVGRYLKPYLGRMSVQLFIKLAGTVVELFLPSMLSVILDDCAPAGDVRGVWLMGAGMLLCAAGALVGNVVANRMATSISRDATQALRRDLFARVSSLSASQRDRLTDASIISRLTSDTYNVHQMIDRMQRLGVRAPIMLLGGMLVSLTLEPVLTLVLAATLPLLAVTIIAVSRKGVPLFTKVQLAQDRMVRKVQENMTGARVIRALSRTDWERQRFGEVNDRLAASQQKADVTMATVSPVVNLLLNVGLAAVIVVGAWRTQLGLTQPGAIIAFLSYFTMILNALLMVSRLFVMYSKGSASARRIESVMILPDDLTSTDTPVAADASADVHVDFRHVSFSYNGAVDNLHDVSFTLRHGETLGIIGPTGAGKSTLLALLLRQYDPTSGVILLDGQPLNALSPEMLHDGLGVVFQSDFLMADTLRENIRFGRALNDAALMDAADCAQAGFIREKEGGLDFPLNMRGRNLSGGQQQRVLIARALAGSPKLLLLDDCSSALDFRTDRALRHALRQRHGNATTVLVAQRVSSVMAADNILVMDGGRVIGNGTHQELCRTCDMYRELCRIQLGGEAV